MENKKVVSKKLKINEKGTVSKLKKYKKHIYSFTKISLIQNSHS